MILDNSNYNSNGYSVSEKKVNMIHINENCKNKNKVGAIVSVGAAGAVTCGGSVVAINRAPYFVVFINLGAIISKDPKSLESYYEGHIHRKNVKLTPNGIQL